MKRFASALLAMLLVLTMVVPNFVGPARAETAGENPSQDMIPERPKDAEVFFDSEKEAYSFNTATYWDVYQQNLGVEKGTKDGVNAVNQDLVLTSSTDGALVSKGAVTKAESVQLELTEWGSFTNPKVIDIPDVPLKAGANDINVQFDPGADVRGMYILRGNEEIAHLTPNKVHSNIQAALVVNGDRAEEALTATDKNNGWIESKGTAKYKKDKSCFGWLDNGSITYHFPENSIETEGNYTIRVEYARGKDDGDGSATKSANVVLTVTDPAVNGLKGALRIDYETAKTFTYQQYGESGGSYTPADTAFDYSDGSSTVVGWGGSFSYTSTQHAKYLALTMKCIDGPELKTVLNYLTIHLVNKDGTNVATLKASDKRDEYASGFGGDYRTYVYGPLDIKDEKNDVQGIKLVFERGNHEKDISGSIELAYVGICTSNNVEKDASGWIDFCPFDYDMAGFNSFTDVEKAGTEQQEERRPFLRPNKLGNQQTVNIPPEQAVYNKDTLTETQKNATVSGCNVSVAHRFAWHAWTMSTSDANIVSADHATHNGTGSFNALEIKYQNTDYHTTYAKLTGTETRKGQWFAITLKAEDLKAMGGDPSEDIQNIRLVLKKNGKIVNTVRLGDFKTGCTEGAATMSAELLQEGYRTLFYNMGDSQEITTVEFDFSEVKKAGAGEDTHRIYVKDIYLFTPQLVIEKDVDKEVAAAGGTLTYTLTVKNTSQGTMDNYTVKDVLPAGLTYVEGSSEITAEGKQTTKRDPDTATTDGSTNRQTLTWSFKPGDGYSLDKGGSITIRFKVLIPEGAKHGTVYNNMATVGEISSNPVRTTIWDATQNSLTFYAQVGMWTTLNLDLGTTEVETEEEWKETGSYEITVQRGKINNTDADGNPGTGSCGGVTISEGDEVRLTGPEGGFIFKGKNDSDAAVEINGKTWRLNNDGGKHEGFTPHGTIYYHKYSTASGENDADGPDCSGPLSGFKKSGSYVTLDGVQPVTNGTVKLNLAGMWQKNLDFTLSVGHKEKKTEEKNNTFAGLGSSKYDPKKDGFEVGTDENQVGNNKPTLNYLAEPSMAGQKTTFFVNFYPGGDSTKTPRQMMVTVYNYQVSNHKYVLDYGLPVYLTGNKDNHDQSIQGFSGTKLLADEDANDGIRFFGVSGTKINNDDEANPGDYKDEKKLYNLAGGTFKNGTVTTTFGNADSKNQTILYTPTRFMDSVDTFYYGVQVQKNGIDANAALDATNATPVMEGEITVVPASIVYYEDNFSKSGTEEADGQNGILYGEGHSTKGTSKKQYQSNELNLRYGYDEAYANDGTYSGNSATKMEAGSYAMFQFKGTGIDIISSTADNTGTVYVYVFDNAQIGENGTIEAAKEGVNPELVDVQIVNTYYENNGGEGLYQIPVVNIRELKGDKTHVVKILVSSVGKANPVYLDGLRIYNPLGEADSKEYYDASELNTNILELRDMILGDGYKISYDTDGKATVTVNEGATQQASLVRFGTDKTTFLTGATVTENFTGAYYNNNQTESTNPAMTANLLSYLVQGPNNEVYLSEGYGVAFYVSEGNGDGSTTLQVGAKMLMGAPNLQYRNADDKWVGLDNEHGGTIQTATEMYYEIPLSECQGAGNGKYLVALRVGNGVASTADDGVDAVDKTPKNVISLTYLKASNNLVFSSVEDRRADKVVDANFDVSGIKSVVEPGANHRRTITFATDKDVLDVKVYLKDKEVTATAASYVFADAGNKTWLVTYDASGEGPYSLKLIQATGESKGIIAGTEAGE